MIQQFLLPRLADSESIDVQYFSDACKGGFVATEGEKGHNAFNGNLCLTGETPEW